MRRVRAVLTLRAKNTVRLIALAALCSGGAAAQSVDRFDDVLARVEREQPDQSLWASGRIAAYRHARTVELDAALAVLSIPAIDLDVPVYTGTGEVVLNRGVGWIEGTAPPDAIGNLGLAAHRDGFFRGLKDLRVGDRLSVRTNAELRHYRISEFLVVEPTDVYVLDPTPERTVTLVTCYPFYFVGDAPQRYIVRAIAERTAL